MSKFKVGDRVRVKEWYNAHLRPDGSGIVVGELNDCDCHAVEFPGWEDGHDGDKEDGSESRWFVSVDNMEFLFHHPIDAVEPVSRAPTAKFHVIYVEDEDDVFDTQAEAEAFAEDLAADEPGTKVAVLRLVSTTTLDLAIERFA